MMDDKRDAKSRKAHDPIPTAAIPGDPFPWSPDLGAGRALEPGEAAEGSTRSPAETGDIASFDLGGGD